MTTKENPNSTVHDKPNKNTDLKIVHIYNMSYEGKSIKQENNNQNNSISYAINKLSNNLFQNSNSNLKSLANVKTLEIKDELNHRNDDKEKDIVDNTLFNQISDINIRLLLYSKENNEDQNCLPKVQFIELTLLNQSLFSISKFKKYGFAIYVFFFYLRNLLFTFFVLFGFAFYYMYCIFFKYYPHFDDEYSLFSDYNLLTLVSGVQIIRYRKYYINEFGKDAFLKKYKNFDVFYKEYIYSGILLLIFVFVVNFFLIIYLIRKYESYKLKHQENFPLILSGEILSKESKSDKI